MAQEEEQIAVYDGLEECTIRTDAFSESAERCADDMTELLGARARGALRKQSARMRVERIGRAVHHLGALASDILFLGPPS